jgi:hypothetical protein
MGRASGKEEGEEKNEGEEEGGREEQGERRGKTKRKRRKRKKRKRKGKGKGKCGEGIGEIDTREKRKGSCQAKKILTLGQGPLKTLSGASTLKDLVTVFTEDKMHRVYVVEDGKATKVISLGDLLRFLHPVQ